jgi:hypothetical protein
MAHSNENTSEQRDFENETSTGEENVSSVFDDMLRSYRSASEALRLAVQSARSSDAVQRAAGLSTANSAAEQIAKHHQSLTGISDSIKKLEPPQLAPLALKASAEISQQLKATFELQKSIIPSSGTIAAAARLASASTITHRMIEALASNEHDSLSALLYDLPTTAPIETDVFDVTKQSLEYVTAAQKYMGIGLSMFMQQAPLFDTGSQNMEAV